MAAVAPAAIDRKQPRRRSLEGWAWPAASLAALLLVWWLTSLLIGNVVVLPTPLAVVREIAALAQSGELGGDLETSLVHLLLGYLIGAALGTGLGFLMGVAAGPRTVFRTSLELLRPIPPIAWIPAGLLLFGVGPQLPITLIAYASFFPFWVNTLAGVQQLPRPLAEASRTLGAQRWMFWREVVLPSALPSILVGARVALGLAWWTIVAAELVGGTRGLGFLITKSANYLDSAGIIAGMLVIATLSFGMDGLLKWLERRLCRWVPGASR